MKKPLFLALILCLFLLVAGIDPVGASSVPSSGNTHLNQAPGNVFTFEQLGYQQRIMTGPYDTETLLFSLPDTWRLTTDSTFTLHYNFTAGGASIASSIQQGSYVGGTLLVLLNDVVIDTIVLNQTGDATQDISIPSDALSTTGRYNLNFFLDASIQCEFNDVKSTLIIYPDSQANFQHQLISPPTDLRDFPRPVYQPNSLFKTGITIVVPDQPSAGELQAALAVSTGLGSLTNGNADTKLLPVSKLDTTAQQSDNLIFVGSPAKFSVLQDVQLPIPAANGRLTVNGASDSDGIIQLAQSPWNPATVVLFISGNSDEAVIKAAQAIGTGVLVPANRPDVSIIRNVNPTGNPAVVAEDETFADLGYTNETVSGVGSGYLSFDFYVSPEQASSTGAYLDLVTTHSDLLNFGRTGVTLILNDEAVGSLHFKETDDSVVTTRIKLLPNVLHRGSNLLEFISNLVPIDECFAPDSKSAWVTVSNSSTLHLPISAQPVTLGSNLDLGNFPTIFLTNRNQEDLAFIMPADDPAAWAQASRTAFFLGNYNGISLTDLNVSFGNDVSEEVLKNRSMLLFGRATLLPKMIDQLKSVLPAPFEAGTDEAVQPSMLVNYRLLPGVSVGYVQLFPSPWNPDRAILAAMGNTADGEVMAGDSLVKPNLTEKLAGNFAIAYGSQILTTDTRLGSSTHPLAADLPSVAVTATPASVVPQIPLPSSAQIQGRAWWLLPAFLVTLVFIVILAVVMLVRRRIATRKPEKETKLPENKDEN